MLGRIQRNVLSGLIHFTCPCKRRIYRRGCPGDVQLEAEKREQQAKLHAAEAEKREQQAKLRAEEAEKREQQAKLKAAEAAFEKERAARI